jgi:two-component sensor histidine kinase
MNALDATGLMDSDPEPQFDRITRLICQLLAVDVSLISLVDPARQFFKSSCGLPADAAAARGTPLTHSFCQYVVASEHELVVGNAHEHPLLASNLAVRDLGVVAYLGVPIRSHDGHVLGSLCAIQASPRQWSDADRGALEDFARIVEDGITLRGKTHAALSLAEHSETLAREYGHRAKNTLALAVSLLNLSAREAGSVEDLRASLRSRLLALASAYDALLADSGSVHLKTLLSQLLLPFNSSGKPITLDGPPILLGQRQATPVCLVVHELATNSAKYGALADHGTLNIGWSVDNGTVSLHWREETSAEPYARGEPGGFGTQLLSVAARQLGGEISHSWHDTVFTLTLSFPVAD